MESNSPRLDEARSVSRWRWGIHLALITLYLVLLLLIGLGRKVVHPALSHTAKGLVVVCALELLSFGLVFALAWLASRASADDLLLRWRGKVTPVLLGAAYSVGLRLGIGLAAVAVAVILLVSRAMTLDSLQTFAQKNQPGVDKVVDVAALRNNPAYYWMALTIVSFLVGGLREELWRSSFLAGMKRLWPGLFGSLAGQIGAVVIAALIFGAAHLSMGILAAGMAGLIGLGLGLIMVFHRSIWPA